MKTILTTDPKKLLRIFSFLSFVYLLVVPQQLFAADEKVINSAAPTAGTSFWVYDGKYAEMLSNPSGWQTSFSNRKVTNIVRLAPMAGLSANFEVKINVTVEIKKWNPTLMGFETIPTVTDLQIASSTLNNPSVTVNDKQALVLQGGHAVKVTINSVNFISGSTAISNLVLTSEIIIDRQYFINNTAVSGLGHFPSGGAVASASELELSWDYKTGAEWYELEYVHISRLGENGALLFPANLSFNYYLNSTRVEVKGNHYTIPKVYDRGYVIYRVRAIGFNGLNYSSRFESDWSAVESGNLSVHPATNLILIENDHNTKMNWTFSATFAEDGKRSDAIQYGDGMNRGRQSIVSNPATSQVIVNNTYYDEMGRPAVVDLPTPVDQTALRHLPNFNRTNDGSNFNYTLFDASAEDCAVVPNAFSKDYGAGKYYSDNNPDKIGANAGIPDAEGFPYVRTVYKNDLTNRIDKQGSAGATLKTHGGKETRYVELTSDRLELNMLFGTDIGKSEHYQKTAVIDQNGQAMISYTDMAGRTIATYLTGATPASLDALPENVPTAVSYSMITNGDGDDAPAGFSSTMTHTKLITESGNYTFNYAFTPEEYVKVCGSNAICLDCVYDFNLKIVDECGTVHLDHTEKINGESLDAACNSEYEAINPISVYLSGEQTGISGIVYTISKNLSVNQEAIADYWCYALDASCIEVPDIFNDLYNNATFTSCLPNEDNSYGDGPCGVYKAIMLQDMSPGGQYAAYNLDGVSYSFTDPLSILNTSTPGSKYSSVTYLDQLGVPIMVLNNAGVLVSPAALLPVEFIQKFDAAWAPSLLLLHPEYCFYSDCIAAHSTASIAFDEAMSGTASFQQALANGYFNPVPATSITTLNPNIFNSATSTADPYFTVNPALAGTINNMMADYIVIDGVHYSMWDYAIILGVPCTGTAILDCVEKATSEKNCSLDYIWLQFRKLYLQEKKNLINQQVNKTCPDNCKIGVSGDYELKTRVFPCWSELSANNPTPLPSELQDEIDELCNETCTDYADEWLAKLSGCNIPAGNLPDIRQDLINLCKSGCSIENPQGFSTDINGNGINSVLIAYGISETDLCTELLIADPEPYRSLTDEQNATFPLLDVCACDVILQAKQDLDTYLATNPTPALFTTLEQMLAHNTGIPIEEATPLLCACENAKAVYDKGWSETNEQAQNALAQYGYRVPAELACSGGDCADCATVNAAMSALDIRLPGLINSPSHTTIVTNYLNGLYHQTYTYFQYLEFFSKCNASSEAVFCTPNPATPELLNMLTLLAYRGQLTSASPINLLSNNAVYQYGQIRHSLPFPGLADYSYEVNGNMVSMKFGQGQNTCDLLITNAQGIDFNAIQSFDMVTNEEPGCNEEPTYNLIVTYRDCGQTKSASLPLKSNCFKFYDCTCDPVGVNLCEVAETAPDTYCYTQTLNHLYNSTRDIYRAQVDAAYELFVQEYNSKCAAAFATENLNYLGYQNNYQYTLFYYDQAGNLVRTVAPEWNIQLNETQNEDIEYNRLNNLVLRPNHLAKTEYKYNSYNQLVNTTNPDQTGATNYFYDYYGRMVASQNPEQAVIGQYSYVLYDTQGRPVESGQMNRTVPSGPGGAGYTVQALSENSHLKKDDLGAAFKSWVYLGVRSEVTVTTYDKPLSAAVAAKFKSGVQQNLRLRVATVAYFETVPLPVPANYFQTGYTSAVHYSYDIHGNVIEQLQDVPDLAPVKQDVKSTQYDFELISGNVKQVTFQAGEHDQFIHRYDYDAINRLTETHTSPDDYTYSREAHYLYYDYGPLARKELGQEKVQAEDFAYTINGWMKLKNGTMLNPLYDAGKDGRRGYELGNVSGHLNIPADVTGYTLGYFEGDYKSISGSNFETPTAGSAFSNSAANLYNGNIRLSTTAIQNVQPAGTPGVYTNEVIGASYRYDQLNRLKSMTAYFSTGIDNGTAGSWTGATTSNAYSSTYTYDRNGNLKTLNRYANSATNPIDQLTYHYANFRNRLHKVNDATGPAAFDDISNDQTDSNYVYDRLGQLTRDNSEGITEMLWRKGDKKLRSMIRNTHLTQFLYDPFGRRIAKIYRPNGTADKTQWIYTYYAQDANGATMAVYDIKYNTNYVYLKEQHLYGAGRLGMVQLNKPIYANAVITPPAITLSTNTLGNKRYELTNHLGNVNAVITDRKAPNPDYSTLVHDFDFATTGHTGWGYSGCSGYSVSLNSGRLRFNPGSACVMHAYKDFQVSSGKLYTVSFDLDRSDIGNFNVEIYTAATSGGTGTLVTTITNPANGTINYTFTPGQAYVRVYFRKISTENTSFYIDNLRIQTMASPYMAMVVMTSDYYPFGYQMPGRHTDDDKYRYGYTGKEKDPEIKGQGNSYDFGNRQYDPRLGRWLSLDPLKEMYTSMSPYCYAGNMPIAAKDPDGRLIIFVNGYRFGEFPGPGDDLEAGEGYWSEAKEYDRKLGKWYATPKAFRNEASNYFNDNQRFYVDGTGADMTSTPAQRFDQGRAYALAIKDALKESLGENETIKFLTHSMGAAYAEGMISVFMEDADLKGKIEKVVHLSPADADNINISDNSKSIPRTQLSLTGDITLSYADMYSGQQRIKGVQTYGLVLFEYFKWHPDRINTPKEHDPHYETKSNFRTFDVLRDLEGSVARKVGSRTYGDKVRNIYSVSYFNGCGPRFLEIFTGGRFLKNIGPYGNGADKFKGPLHQPDNWDHRDGGTGPSTPKNSG